MKLQDAYRVSQRRAVNALGVHRSVIRYNPIRPLLDAPIRKRTFEIAAVRIRYGYMRIYVLLRREGWMVNHKRLHRIYRLAGLSLGTKRPKRKRMAAHRVQRPEVLEANDCWTMDFVSDALFDNRRFRALTVIDQFTRECLAIHADQSIKGKDVVRLMQWLVLQRGAPKRIQTDNGSEFISKVLDKWAYEHAVTMDFSRPGKATDNPFIESFNGSFRDECLNVHWFLSLEDAREKIDCWREEYNHQDIVVTHKIPSPKALLTPQGRRCGQHGVSTGDSHLLLRLSP
jgi:putative transposase